MKILTWVLSTLFLIGLLVFAVLQLTGLAPKQIPQVNLPIYAQNGPAGIQPVGGPCPQEKCLIAFLTPWCPKCRESVGSITQLSKTLSANGVPVSIVIGDDSKDAVLKFAASFSVPVLLDIQNGLFSQVPLPGTPYLAVTNEAGVIINDLSGFVADANTLQKSLNL